jgi:hypothetical protein
VLLSLIIEQLGARLDASPATRVKMTTKVCLNSKCPAYAHLVYTVAMRCVLCRCDLLAAQRNAEAAEASLARPDQSITSALSRKAGRAPAIR